MTKTRAFGFILLEDAPQGQRPKSSAIRAYNLLSTRPRFMTWYAKRYISGFCKRRGMAKGYYLLRVGRDGLKFIVRLDKLT